MSGDAGSPPDVAAPDGRDVVRFVDATEFDAWLEQHHDQIDGIWALMAKAHTGFPSLSWKSAVPVALCHGWIDGQSRRVDDDWFIQKFTPRRPRSIWSKVNVAHVERLIAEGAMRPWGLEQVERAKADGRWDAAYHGPAAGVVPEELQRALDASPAAATAFAALTSSQRYAMTHRIMAAKRVETKERNAAKFVAMLERGESL